MMDSDLRMKTGTYTPDARDKHIKIYPVLPPLANDMAADQRQALPFTDAAPYHISRATARNWQRLHTPAADRLTARANKRKSGKRVLPLEYFRNKENALFVQNTLDEIDRHPCWDIMSVFFSLAIALLKSAGIYEKPHVLSVLSEYDKTASRYEALTTALLPQDEFDILGLIYQSYLREGTKNIIGSYYTPEKIARYMTNGFTFSNGELFLDPCCGSGAFLLAVPAAHPKQIFGVDNDKVAVFIAKINLLLHYRDFEFIPQIYALDFLVDDSNIQRHPIFGKIFDYIATNPPWGAMDAQQHKIQPPIAAKETFSYFFVKAHRQLQKNGTIRFLFPESILKVKIHKDIRQFILNTAGLVSLTLYDDMFSGVTTKYIDIACSSAADKETFTVCTKGKKKIIATKTIYETKNLVFNFLSPKDIAIVQTVKERGRCSLQGSLWALGIVTGDNKGKISPTCAAGMEKIYTGKEIQPFILKPAKNYIRYDRNQLQQVARECIYRAPEKLVYKFISNRLVFAYDDSRSLFLNSANILIPAIPSMSVKSVMAFLNSTLFQFMYMKLFGEVKILKGNLLELPFPEISAKENHALTACVDDILKGDLARQAAIDDRIFAIYGFTDDSIAYIRRTVHGNID